MPINISVSPRINPRDKEEAPKFFGKVQTRGTRGMSCKKERGAIITTPFLF